MSAIKNKYLDYTGLTAYNEKMKAKNAADHASTLSSAKNYSDSLSTSLTAKIETKAEKATTLAGYGITNAYMKTQTDSAISAAVANAGHLKREIVSVLPDTALADSHTIYMLARSGGSGSQKYDEYMLINDLFEKIGDSAVDLTGYATKAYAEQLSEGNVASILTNADEIDALKQRITALESAEYAPITDSEIAALFTVD